MQFIGDIMSFKPLATISEQARVQFTVKTSIDIDDKEAEKLYEFFCKVNPPGFYQNRVNIPNGTSMMIIENKNSLSLPDNTGVNFIVPYKSKHPDGSDTTLRTSMHSIDLPIEEIEKIKRIFTVINYPSTSRVNFPEGTSIEILTEPSLAEKVAHRVSL